MNEPHDPNETVDASSAAADSLDAGLAAGFGRRVEGPASIVSGSDPPSAPCGRSCSKKPRARARSSCGRRPTPCRRRTRPATATALDGEIARGGMGAVLRGRDVDLGRDLAVKVLLEKYANRPDVARRFIEEAQIGGQLQHPGRRAGLRHRPVRRPAVLHHEAGEGPDALRHPRRAHRPGRRSAAPPGHRLAGGAGDGVCPRQGVIHRDLKPANIMVGCVRRGAGDGLGPGQGAGRRGRCRRGAGQPGCIIRAAGHASFAPPGARGVGSFGTDTEAGSILGTPAYMPPEQASGDIPNLDRRADVFALGAILCEILTGKPPYVGRSNEEVRRKAANGDLADATARLDGCGADPELVALTKQCLSAEAIDRPKDAQVVVDALTSYLDGVQERLQTAERERAVAEAREHEEREAAQGAARPGGVGAGDDAGDRGVRLLAERAGPARAPARRPQRRGRGRVAGPGRGVAAGR